MSSHGLDMRTVETVSGARSRSAFSIPKPTLPLERQRTEPREFSPDSSAMPSQRRRTRRASPVAGDDSGNRGSVLKTRGSIHRVPSPAYPPQPHRPHSPRSSSGTPTHRAPLSSEAGDATLREDLGEQF